MDRRPERVAVLKNLLRERIVILDGAMGTTLQSLRLDEAAFRGSKFRGHPKDLRGNFDVLNLTRPEVVQAIQRQYLEAGADIIKTNTFNSNAFSQGEYALQDRVHALNVAGAQIARQIVPAIVDDDRDARSGRRHRGAPDVGPDRSPNLSTMIRMRSRVAWLFGSPAMATRPPAERTADRSGTDSAV